ncbi:MAG: M28 family peptidase, partial [Bacteroidota bacterium]
SDYTLKYIKQNSDHYPFYEKGIPVVYYNTGLHPQYHSPEDEVSRIDYSKMKRIAQLAFMVGYKAGMEDF